MLHLFGNYKMDTVATKAWEAVITHAGVAFSQHFDGQTMFDVVSDNDAVVVTITIQPTFTEIIASGQVRTLKRYYTSDEQQMFDALRMNLKFAFIVALEQVDDATAARLWRSRVAGDCWQAGLR